MKLREIKRSRGLRQLALETLERRMLLAVDGLLFDLSGIGGIDLFRPGGSAQQDGLLDGYFGHSVGYTIQTANQPGSGNSPPKAIDDTTTTGNAPRVGEDSGAIDLTNLLLANDTDPDPRDRLAIRSVVAANLQGQLTLDPATGKVLYDPDGQFESLNDGETATETFRYVVADGSGETDSASVLVTIDGANDAPLIGFVSGQLTVDEGDTATANGTIDDVDANDSRQLTASLGTVTDNNDGTWSWSFDTSDGGDEGQTVAITATDGAGATAVVQFQLQVDNVAPTISLSGDPIVDEGTPYSLTLGLVTDPGTDTVAQYVVDWGDGSSDTYTAGGPQTHTYADGGAAYTITVDLVDEDGTHAGAGSLPVAVNNVPPTIALSGAAAIDEGTRYELQLGAVTDPGTDTISLYTVDWDDGTSNSFTSLPGLLRHTYADGDAVRDISVTMQDEDGIHLAGTQQVTIANVAPTVELTGDDAVDEGTPFRLTLGAAIDPGADSVQQYVVHWGDGTSDTFGTGGAMTHTYPDGPASHTILVDLVDEDGTHTGAGRHDVTVHNVAPVIPLGGADSVVTGTRYLLTPGDVADPGLDTVTQYVVHWGDGTSNTFTALPGLVRHTYSDAPGVERTIEVELHDEDGIHTGGSRTITVVAAQNLLSAVGQGSGGTPIAPDQLIPMRDEALRRWHDSLPGTAMATESLSDVEITIADLPEGVLGTAETDVITIDVDAAGHGWFVDPTPADDSEFTPSPSGDRSLHAAAPAAQSFDLLTVIMHELGHVVNYRHAAFDREHLMARSLSPATRRLPWPEYHEVGEDLLNDLAHDVARAW